MDIELRIADPTTYDGDALLVPIACEGPTHDGLAARIKTLAGNAPEAYVLSHAPIAVGAALVAKISDMVVKNLIYVPAIETPGDKFNVENIRRATKAGLLAATKHELNSVAIPGFGYGEAGVPPDEIARALVDEVRGYKKLARAYPKSVVFIDNDPDMVEAFKLHI